MSAWLLSVTAIVVGCASRPDRVEGWSQEAPGGSDAVDVGDDETEVDVPSESEPASSEASAAESSAESSAAASDSEASAETTTDETTNPEGGPEVTTPEVTASTDPDPAADPAADSVASLISLPDANISIQGVEADGQRLDVLQCRASNLPLFGSMVVVASIAEQKRALDRCAPEGAAVAIRWHLEGGKARDFTVEHASSARVGTCVAKAMKKVTAPFSAECGAVVLVGKPAGADAALAKLRAAAGH